MPGFILVTQFVLLFSLFIFISSKKEKVVSCQPFKPVIEMMLPPRHFSLL